MLQRLGPVYSVNCTIAGELMLLEVRCLDGSKARAEGAVRLDFLRNEKKATKNIDQRASCVEMDKSNTVFMP